MDTHLRLQAIISRTLTRLRKPLFLVRRLGMMRMTKMESDLTVLPLNSMQMA